ncbi:MAG: fimbrial protein [Rhizobiaceae bacterium]
MTEQAPIKNQAELGGDEDKPLDPAVERVRRKMMRLMAISIGIMMIGLMAVLFAIVYKISARDEAAAPAGDTFETVIAIPPGAKIVSQSLSGDRLTLLAEHANGRQTIFIFDTAMRKVVGRIEVGSE